MSQAQSVTPGLAGTAAVPSGHTAPAAAVLRSVPRAGAAALRVPRLTPRDRPVVRNRVGFCWEAPRHSEAAGAAGGSEEVGWRLEVKKKFQLIGRAHIFPI